MKLIFFNGCAGSIGMIVVYAYGGWSGFFALLLLTIAVDYVSGVMAAIKEKSGLNSMVGFWGLAKKALMLLIVMLAHRIDVEFGMNMVMNGAICFYLANELISITENCGRLGLPIPGVIRRMIEILKDKNENQ